MKKLIAAALTGALVLGTVGTSVVFAADDVPLEHPLFSQQMMTKPSQ